MRNIRLTIQYDGTDYSGWQIQQNGITVQGLLESAISKVTGEKIRVTGAGRTDAGVHALDQVAVFKSSSKLETEVIINALNANLPSDIRVIKADDVDDNFHPRYDAIDKLYSYLISYSDMHSIFLKRYSWQISWQLDSTVIREAAKHIIGQKDFSSFQASGCSAKHPVRNVLQIEIQHLRPVCFMGFTFDVPLIKISIRANAFLRHMARNIVGTLVEAGKGRIKKDDMVSIIESKNRNNAGPTAPACGLFLEKINY